MFLIWNCALAPLHPALALYTLWRRFIKKKSPQSLAGQWGIVAPAMREFGDYRGARFWIHAVSVGELVTARVLIAAIKSEFPGCKIALSTTTDAGLELAATLLQNGEADVVFGFPLDLPWVLRRVLGALRPHAIGFVETELWPNLLHMARQRGIETFLLNGRISDNLLRSAPRLGPLWSWMRGNVSQFLMRDEDDAARLKTLGAREEQVLVTGDAKLETPVTEAARSRETWRAALGLNGEKLLIAGSTHAGEEALILASFRRLRDDHPDWQLALAPRHIERCAEVARAIIEAGFWVTRRSEGQKLGANGVFLLDSVGELADFYAAGDCALVGGSWIARGGHNLLEPVLRGVPVLFGPSVDNFRSAAAFVERHQLGAQVASDDLNGAIERWVAIERAHFWPRATHALLPHHGAALRAARAMKRRLESQRKTDNRQSATAAEKSSL